MNLYLVVTEFTRTPNIFIAAQDTVQERRRTFLAESFEVVHKHVAETFADEQLIAIVDQQTVVTVLS